MRWGPKPSGGEQPGRLTAGQQHESMVAVPPREEITRDSTLGRIRKLRDELEYAIAELSKIERADCDELMALKALKTMFFTDFFDGRIKEIEDCDGDGGNGGGKGGGGDGGGRPT